MVTMSLPLLSISESAPFGSLSAKHFNCINGGKLKSSTQFTPRKMYRINAIAQVDVGVRNWVQANRSALANAVLVGALSLSISLCGTFLCSSFYEDLNLVEKFMKLPLVRRHARGMAFFSLLAICPSILGAKSQSYFDPGSHAEVPQICALFYLLPTTIRFPAYKLIAILVRYKSVPIYLDITSVV
eukprot:Gb_41289 [translate_table: standard]